MSQKANTKRNGCHRSPEKSVTKPLRPGGVLRGGVLTGLVALLASGMAGASPASFSFTMPNPGWLPALLGGQPLSDPEGDSPGPRDVVGDAANPMLYLAADDTHLYFRLRLDSDPRQNATNLAPFGWGCFINIDSDPTSYEFSTLVDGVSNPDQISFFRNTATTMANSPSDPPDLPPVSVVTSPLSAAVGHAQVALAPSTFGGDADYFLDWAIERSATDAAGLDTSAPAQYYCGSSNNGSTIGADCSGSATDNCPLDSQLSDPVSCGAEGCGICGDGAVGGSEGCDDSNLANGDGCNEQCRLELGQPCTLGEACASDFCDPTADICACDQSSDCAPGQLCNSTADPNVCVEPGCGNGLIEPNEACDDGGTAPSDGCSANCLLELGQPCTLALQCQSGFCDSDLAVCACDGDDDCPVGDLCNLAAAPNSCVSAGCGNGVVEAGEGCDDSNGTDGDGCDANCFLELNQPCTLDDQCASEFCDLDVGFCVCDENADCSIGQECLAGGDFNVCIAPGCGNGVVEIGEGCDDDNNEAGDGCDELCRRELGQPCMDGTVCASNFCDPSNDTCACDQAVDCPSGQLCNTVSAPNSCVSPGCGNNVLEAGEGCDDGNTDSADGCSEGCLLELSQPCSEGALCESGFCDGANGTCACDEHPDCPAGRLCNTITDPNSCVEPACGNGVVQPEEGCDDGNTIAGDGCDPNCLLELGESCDAGDVCASGFCHPMGNICACDEDPDCPDDLLCNTALAPSACVPPGCGNGIVEITEACDDSNVDNGDGCTSQCLLELEENCSTDVDCASGLCDPVAQVCACDQDQDCPDGRLCDSASEPNSCVAPGCGNGVLELGEGCDDGNVAVGDGCNAECLLEIGEPCTASADCASTLCDEDGDTCACNQHDDCEVGELCNELASPNACVAPGCGNGVLETGEGCDDGNTSAGDGCASGCLIELGEPCGAGTACASGSCDEQADICTCDEDDDCPEPFVCNSTPSPAVCAPAGCGNGVRESGEGCDDANAENGDGCNAQCLIELGSECSLSAECASGFCDEGGTCACDQDEDCLDGRVCDVSADPNACVAPGCGNGMIELGEACDDGNTVAGDGCSSDCLLEIGEDCSLSLECESGFCDEDNDTCACNQDEDCQADELCNETESPNTCVDPGCGNAVVEPGEGCDDGNTSAGDGCDAACLVELGGTCDENTECSNGFCDPDADVCACDEDSDCSDNQECNDALAPNACVPVGCGNGSLDPGEGCDDSNLEDGDGCNAQCLVELGGDCAADGDCASGSCDQSADICVCDEDSDCGEDELCLDALAISSCVPMGCGNGVIEAGEDCDDGDVADNDGCDASCEVEPGFECTGMPSECGPKACTEDDDCGAREICDLDSGECVGVECNMDSDCNDNEVCDEVSHTCGQCFENADCPSSFSCDTNRSECVPSDEVYASGNGIFCAMTHQGPSRSQGLVLALLALVVAGRRRRQRTVRRSHTAGRFR